MKSTRTLLNGGICSAMKAGGAVKGVHKTEEVNDKGEKDKGEGADAVNNEVEDKKEETNGAGNEDDNDSTSSEDMFEPTQRK